MKHTLLVIGLFAALFTLTIAGGCRKKASTDTTNTPGATGPAATASAAITPAPAAPTGGLLVEKVHFALNRWELSSDATQRLAKDAKTLLANPGLRIRVEGHADERGGTEYNLALSEKRAASIRTYLMDLGIARERIETIAYGEERPLREGHDEESWAANRRGEISVSGTANH